jgi:hypothetical protein
VNDLHPGLFSSGIHQFLTPVNAPPSLSIIIIHVNVNAHGERERDMRE